MQSYKLTEDVWLCENAVFLPTLKTLVISDLQLGMEQQLRAMGHNILYEQAEKMFRLLERLIKLCGAEKLVINGDLKHEFGRISSQERHDVVGLLSKLQRRVEIVVVKGNHDTITAPLTEELGVPLVDSWCEQGIFCVHGHEEVEVPDDAHTIIIGHMHPAVTLHDGVRNETYKCFLAGMYRKKRLVVLPSFSTMTAGTNVLKIGSNSPLVSDSVLEKSEIYVIGDEVRSFGTVKKLRNLLEKL